VRELEPHSEADPASLLVQLLVAAGNALGRETPAYRVESDYHRGRLFTVIVGPTSRGRKGTSWGRVEHVMERVDRDWADAHVLHGGLSTGEGLIQALNNFDSEEEDEESGETFVLPGDKRLLVLEPGFARVLKVAKREGSTISAVIRSLWDRDLRDLRWVQRATGSRRQHVVNLTGHDEPGGQRHQHQAKRRHPAPPHGLGNLAAETLCEPWHLGPRTAICKRLQKPARMWRHAAKSIERPAHGSGEEQA
jgi:hypothetical protein